jgi:His/Glu/Gln/Arg/opine family amino acid ABC transporter permease subunit
VATATIGKPEHGLRWMLDESTPASLTIAITGGLSLAVLAFGIFLYLPIHGLKPVEVLVEGMQSSAFQTILFITGFLGVMAALAGGLSYRTMPTKVSRELAVAGGVLGAQGLFLSLGGYFFTNGSRVDIFAVNYFNFEKMEGNYDLFIRGFFNTVNLAFTSELFGILIGLVLSVFAISQRAVVRAPARTYINVLRGTPLVWQIAFIGIALPIAMDRPIDTYNAAKIALSLNAGAYIAEVFRAGIQSIERGQIEAARGLGMSYMQAMRYAILPQAVRRVIPPLMNEFVILVKDTSLVFVLGLTADQRDLFAVGNNLQQNDFNATYLIFTALGYLAICLPAIRIVNWVEKRLHSGLVGVTG